jgi:hypothetical protein
MARYYSARELGRGTGVSASTANRRWSSFPNGVDEHGRRWVEVSEGVSLLRYPRHARPLRVVDAEARTDTSGEEGFEAGGSIIAALLRELETRSRQIDRLLEMLRRQPDESGPTKAP